MVLRYLILVTLSSMLYACSDSGGSNVPTGVTTTQPDPTRPVAGGGVKGPLVNADAGLFLLDLSASDLKGVRVSTGVTNAMAAIQGVSIPSAAVDTYVLELTSNANTTDLNSGSAPILSTYRTVVGADAIRSGQVFATPVTTLAMTLAARSGPFSTLAELNEALDRSARQVISTLGFGLDPSINPFTSNPLLTTGDTTSEQQQRVLAYRLAVEGLAAVLDLLGAEIRAADPNSTVSVDDVLAAIAEDLSDGVIDGRSSNGAIASLVGVADVSATVATDPALLMVPGTSTPISRISEIVVSETSTTGVVVGTDAITSGSIVVVPKRAKTIPDIDGDGVLDNVDVFPRDANESIDTDGDGTGNNADTDDDDDGIADGDDAFPLDRAESVDTDGDGVGNNADTDDDGDGTPDDSDDLPLDASDTVDTDSDGIGNTADTDDDGDGVLDTGDAFPLLASESVDTDGDGVGNNADTDDDGDGVADADDALPLDAQGSVGTSATIGVNGGTITSPDGLMTLTFPANAVSEDTLITIGTPTDAVRANAVEGEPLLDGLYLLGPQGLQFSEPVTMNWSIPSTSSRPDRVRRVLSRSNGVLEAVDNVVTTDPNLGRVTTKIEHFSEILIFSGTYKIVINSPSGRLGQELLWEYSLEVVDDPGFGTRSRVIFTEKLAGTGSNGEILRVPVEVVNGDEVISDPQHVSAIEFNTAFFDREGSISAVCEQADADGLTARIGFNIIWDDNFSSADFLFNQNGVIRVEANGLCRNIVEITDPTFVSIGNDVDRITEAPDTLVLDECPNNQSYDVVVSNTQTKIVNASGSCSRELNFSANDNSIFGSLVLVAETAARLFTYGESGVFIVELINGVFGELTDFTSVTTDIQHAVDDSGKPIVSQAYSASNNGRVKLRTLNADGTNTNETAFSTFGVGLSGKSFIGYTPTSSEAGFGLISGTPSTVQHINHSGDTATATEIGTVGDTALGIQCTRLSCETGAACSVSNTETVGCVASAFGSEELYPFFSADVVTNATAPTVNFTTTIPGVKTASPFIQSNANGQMVIATVNDNEVGRVLLTIRDKDGMEVQTAEFFLTAYEGTTGFVAKGSSIVLIDPSAEYPNGAVRIGLKNPAGTNDGILTIPVTEALLGGSPVPFFGPAFSN